MLIILSVAIGITAIVALMLRQQGRGTLEIITIPDDAKVTLSQKKIAGNHSISVAHGTYKVEVSRSGFETKAQNVTVTEGKKAIYKFYLAANSPEGIRWLDDHPGQASIIEAEASKASAEGYQRTAKEVPLIKSLPFIDLQYRIDYGKSQAHPGEPGAVAIYIKYWADEGKTQALEWIRFKGYDPSKLEIIYTKATTAFQ